MCPFLESGDPRCSVNQSLHNLHGALGFCAHQFADCPIYRQLLPKDDSHRKLAEPLRIAG